MIKFPCILFIALVIITRFEYSNCGHMNGSVCDEFGVRSQTKFDYSITLFDEVSNKFRHYIYKHVYKWQLKYSKTLTNNVIGVEDSNLRNTKFAFYITIYDRNLITLHNNTLYEKTAYICSLRTIDPVFSCALKNYRHNRVNAIIRFCPDFQTLVAYNPMSFADKQVNQMLFIERYPKMRYKRDVWLTNFKVNIDVIEFECRILNDNDVIAPKFLQSISDSLEITGILSRHHVINAINDNNWAIILFYHNNQHKYCYTHESNDKPMCSVEELLPYLNESCHYNTTNPTLISSETPLASKKQSNSKLIVLIVIYTIIIIALLVILSIITYCIFMRKTKSDSSLEHTVRTESETEDTK